MSVEKSSLLDDLKYNDAWLILEKELLELRPVVPTYNHTEDNTEEWKAKSKQQEGFDLCLSFLKINPE